MKKNKDYNVGQEFVEDEFFGMGGTVTKREQVDFLFDSLGDNLKIVYNRFDNFFEKIFEKSSDEIKESFDKIKNIILMEFTSNLSKLYTKEFVKNINSSYLSLDDKEERKTKNHIEINPFEELIEIQLFLPKIIYLILTNNFSELENLKNCLNIEENKRRTYPIELMKKIHKLHTTSKPKISQQDAVILANRELNIFDEADLLLPNSKGEELPQQLLMSIVNSYKAQKKNL